MGVGERGTETTETETEADGERGERGMVKTGNETKNKQTRGGE